MTKREGKSMARRSLTMDQELVRQFLNLEMAQISPIIISQFRNLLQIGMMLGREMGQSWDQCQDPDFPWLVQDLRDCLPADGWQLPGSPTKLTPTQVQDLLDFIQANWDNDFLPIIDQQTTG